jgi:hypothetical protein
MKYVIMATIIALLFSCASAPAPTYGNATVSSTTAVAEDTTDKDRARELVAGEMGGSSTSSASGGSSSTASDSSAASSGASSVATGDSPMTPEEKRFMENYLARLTYMVFIDETAGIPIDQAKMAVSAANQYLISKLGLTVLDFDTIESRKKDREILTLVETGEAIDVSQAIAMKFNAQVYVKINFTLNSYTREGKAYASITLSIKIYDSSTGVLLGDFNYTPKAPGFDYSGSVQNAIANAIKGGVMEAMPQLTAQTQALMKNSLTRGIMYEVILLNTSDYKQLLKFQQALKNRVRAVEQISYSAKETRLAVYAFKAKDDVAIDIMDAAEAAGMPELSAPVIIGNSFTFTIMY